MRKKTNLLLGIFCLIYFSLIIISLSIIKAKSDDLSPEDLQDFPQFDTSPSYNHYLPPPSFDDGDYQ